MTTKKNSDLEIRLREAFRLRLRLFIKGAFQHAQEPMQFRRVVFVLECTDHIMRLVVAQDELRVGRKHLRAPLCLRRLVKRAHPLQMM